ncbi:MAG: hypothetical protein KC589_06510 [Nanoarchaeota archaeon]|nr:hypothetical protein [Nanoarchaeota archaeon]
MELFVDTLEREIEFYLESANPNIILDSNKINQLISSNIFPNLSYFYNGNDLNELLTNYPNLFNKSNNFFKKIEDDKTFNFIDNFKLANPLSVGLKINSKPLNNYTNLRKSLIEKNIRLEKIIDVEFFEFFKEQKWFLNNISGRNEEKINTKHFHNEKLRNLIANFENKDLTDLEEICNLMGMDITKVLEYINEDYSRLNGNVFTAFMDTEKIHLQFVKCKFNNKSKILLGYYGYGNHKPFMPSLKSKNVSDIRFMREDHLNSKLNLKYYLDELKINNLQTIRNLLNKLNSSQKNYPSYFAKHFSYESRLKQNTNSNKIIDKNDKIFMLNPNTRTRAAALSAYMFFQSMESLNELENYIQK